MPIPTDLLGSLPRPMKLQEAFQAHDDGKMDFGQLQAEQLRDQLVAAAKHIPVERLGATDDCGFSSEELGV